MSKLKGLHLKRSFYLDKLVCNYSMCRRRHFSLYAHLKPHPTLPFSHPGERSTRQNHPGQATITHLPALVRFDAAAAAADAVPLAVAEQVAVAVGRGAVPCVGAAGAVRAAPARLTHALVTLTATALTAATDLTARRPEVRGQQRSERSSSSSSSSSYICYIYKHKTQKRFGEIR